ncbi:MAG: substrate-binding domain-containing protein, partial [Bauldia sp.]
MRKSLLIIAAAVGLAVAAGPAMAQKKTLAVVVKGLDNGFFTVMGKGCADWNAENPDADYECLYTGPALTSDEAGEIQIVQDLIARDDVAGIAISPSNAPAMAKLLGEQADTIKSKGIAVMTIDADLKPEDQGLRTTYFGTHNYGMGVAFCEWLKKLSPNGGKVALMFGNPAAENLNERGYGFRDCIQGAVMDATTTKGRDPLTGQGGWTEVAPTFTNDDIATANQQFADVLAANPDLKAYVLLGGWAQQGCEAFNATGEQYKDRFASGDLVVVAGDTVGCQLGTVRAGFRPVN